MKQLFAITTALFVAAVPASAQITAFGGDDPIDVAAERAKYKGTTTILNGNVDVRQGSVRILADQMVLIREHLETDESGIPRYGNVNTIVAKGRFKYITPENSVSGDKGVYERDKNIITITGNVSLQQKNGNTATGDHLVYNVKTNRARFEGSCSGENCDISDRVVVRIGQ